MMQIKKIHLVNYRGMEDLTVEFAPGVNIIIGNNGAGKSSLLSGLSVGLGCLFVHSANISAKAIEKEDVRVTSQRVGDATENMTSHIPVTVECDLTFCDTDYSCLCKKDNEASVSVVMIRPLDATDRMEELITSQDSILPLLNYQNANRGSIAAGKRGDAIKLGQVERRQGYRDSLSGKNKFESIEDWCARMDYAEYKFRREVAEYRLFKRIVSKFVKEIEEMEAEPKVDFSPRLNQLVYSEGDDGQLIHNLSAGYQSVLCLIMELAYRTALLNPRLEDLESLEGVVLIDEIDMHLHPRWQWRILGALRATFPKVQFILATHSPIVISSAKDARLLLMKNPNEVQELPDAYGYNIGDVLELTQSSMDMPQEVKEWRRQIERALDEDDLPKAEAIVQGAADRLGEGSSTVKRMREFLEVNKWIVDD